MLNSYCLLTKTYKGDIEPFARLCASIDRHMPDVRHYVLIDKSDAALFAGFAAGNRILVDCGKLLPKFHEFNLFGKRMWWRFPHRIVRGWIYQQLAKIAFAGSLEEDAVVMVDSDAIFLRPITHEHVFPGARVRLYQYPGRANTEEFNKWNNVALRAFGLPETGYAGHDYITQAAVWSPEVVRRMISAIEHTSGRCWYDTLIANFRFSEFVLYGLFCHLVPGEHQAIVHPTDVELCHCSWHYDLATDAGLDDFVSGMRSDQIAILIQSNLHLSSERRTEILRRFDNAGGALLPSS